MNISSLQNRIVLYVHKGEVRRYKAVKNSAKSIATVTFPLHTQQEAKCHCSFSQRPWCSAALRHTSGAAVGLRAGPWGVGRKPKNSGIKIPAMRSIHSTLVLKAALKETQLLGWMPFRGIGQDLIGSTWSSNKPPPHILQLQPPVIAAEQLCSSTSVERN